jgi:carbamoyl-phosphate synthase large subunit
MQEQAVLVTSAGAKISQLEAVRAAMRRSGLGGPLWAADANPTARARYFADRFWEMPSLDALPVEVLAEFCQRNHIGALIPTRDGELEFFSGNSDKLRSRGIRVMVPPAAAVSICADKLRFADWAISRNHPVIPASDRPLESFGEHLVIKERLGAGSRGVKLNVPRKDIAEAIVGSVAPMFQPYVQGIEFSVDTYLTERGDVKACVSRTRDVVVGGESKVTTLHRDADIEAVVSALVRDIGSTYHSVVQVLRDAGRRLWIIECNCRFGGASTLAIAAGIDSFGWFFAEKADPGLGLTQAHLSNVPLRQVRYEADRVIELPGRD